MKILIVGAGIAGLAAAKALELKGYKPQIVERRSRSNSEGQSLFLLGNATRALKELCVNDQVRSMGQTIHMQTILSSDGSLLNEVFVDTMWGATGPCLSVPRQVLVDALEASLEESRISHNTSVLRTVSKSEGREVHFLDGRVENFDLVIGADGIRSPLRTATFPMSYPRSLGLAAWRIVVDNQYGIDRWTAMLGKKPDFVGNSVERITLALRR